MNNFNYTKKYEVSKMCFNYFVVDDTKKRWKNI